MVFKPNFWYDSLFEPARGLLFISWLLLVWLFLPLSVVSWAPQYSVFVSLFCIGNTLALAVYRCIYFFGPQIF